MLSSKRLVDPLALLSAVAASLAAMLIATARWRLLLAACGATVRPRFWALFRVYWIGAFYNAWVPGGVAGELARGLATRRVVRHGGLVNALGIALLDRTLGFGAVVITVTAAFTLIPSQSLPDVPL